MAEQIPQEDLSSIDTSDLHQRATQYDVIEETGGRALTEDERLAFEAGDFQVWQGWRAEDSTDATDAYEETLGYADEVIEIPPPSNKPTAIGRAIRVLVGLLILLVLIFLVP